MQPGEILWTPGPERIRSANVTAFADWLARERGKHFADYAALWRWSVEDLEGFWQALWDYFNIESSTPYTHVLGRPPAEADLQRHFGVSPPSVHQMVLTLERTLLIRRKPGVARSIEVLVAPELLPVLR